MKQKYIMYVIAFMCFTLGCKKYDEGPRISFRTKNHRIEGKWKTASYFYDNLQQMDHYDNFALKAVLCQSGESVFMYPKSGLVKLEWEIKKDGTATRSYSYNFKDIDYNLTSQSCTPIYARDDIHIDVEDHTWEFSKDKTKLIFIDKTYGSRFEYEIIELKEKRIQLRREAGTPKKTYLYTLEKI